ncbi:MAG TPA: FlgD immunoglobulin-like domain containing protein [Candidatus Krumholzibacteria bacterium]|nr:FlgD immunoglobulin-like domain containing protein [Candidatus Krumholzibacteria bacterium]
MHGSIVSSRRFVFAALLCLAPSLAPLQANAQCAETQFQNYTGGGQVVCPCFVANEQAGAVFTLPANVYPIEILKVGIGWGSQFGGSGQTLGEAINIYGAGLPNPGAPIFQLIGPQLTDGVINEFNLGPLPGEIVIPSGSFMVALEFNSDNAGDPFAASVVHDGNGCQGGKNTVFAIPGGWQSACALGVTGDWVIYVKYRSLKVTAAANPPAVAFSGVPGNQTTCSTVNINNTGCADMMIKSITGCGTTPFSVDTTLTSHTVAPGGSTTMQVCVTPTSNAPANCAVTVKSNASNTPTTINVTLSGVTAVGSPAFNAYGIVAVVPNPFNPQTSIHYSLPRELAVTAEIYAVDGSRVLTLLSDEPRPAGENEVRWDGRNSGGQRVASGVYLFRLTSTLGARTARLVLLE